MIHERIKLGPLVPKRIKVSIEDIQKSANLYVKKLAYSKWEKAGKPEGRDLEFWFQAEEEIKERTKKYTNFGKPLNKPALPNY